MSEDAKPAPARISLRDLLYANDPEKLPVSTAVGTLYVRRLGAGESKFDVTADDATVARQCIRLATNPIQDKREVEPLDDALFAGLSTVEVLALAAALATQRKFGALPADGELSALGKKLRAEKAEFDKARTEQMERTMATFTKSLGFLDASGSKSVLDAVRGVEDARKLLGLGKIDETVKRLTQGIAPSGFSESVLGTPSARHTMVEPPVFPDWHETEQGQLAHEQKKIIELTGERITAIADAMSTLQLAVIQQIVPALSKQVSDAKMGSILALIFAVGAIAVSAGAAWWQVDVAKDIDRGNTKQLEQVIDLLQKSNAAQTAANQQQAETIQRLRAQAQTPVRPPAAQKK